MNQEILKALGPAIEDLLHHVADPACGELTRWNREQLQQESEKRPTRRGVGGGHAVDHGRQAQPQAQHSSPNQSVGGSPSGASASTPSGAGTRSGDGAPEDEVKESE